MIKENFVKFAFMSLALCLVLPAIQALDVPGNLIANPNGTVTHYDPNKLITVVDGWNHRLVGENDPSDSRFPWPCWATALQTNDCPFFKVEMYDWKAGMDAKWYPDFVNVVPGQNYEVILHWKSSIPLTIKIDYINSSNKEVFQTAAKLLGPSNDWQWFGAVVKVPPGCHLATVMAIIPGDTDPKTATPKNGSLETNGYVLKPVGNLVHPPDLPKNPIPAFAS